MAAKDHTCLRTARLSADTKSTDISRNLPPGMEVPSGAELACDAETTLSKALHDSMDPQSISGAASTSAKPAAPILEDASFVRVRIRRKVGRLCDYFDLGSSMATVASRTAFASIDADDRSLANDLADLADLIEEQVTYLRITAGIDCSSSAARRGTLNLPLEIAGTASQLGPEAAVPPESPN